MELSRLFGNAWGSFAKRLTNVTKLNALRATPCTNGKAKSHNLKMRLK